MKKAKQRTIKEIVCERCGNHLYPFADTPIVFNCSCGGGAKVIYGDEVAPRALPDEAIPVAPSTSSAAADANDSSSPDSARGNVRQ